MKQNIKISFIIPIHNESKLLREKIEDLYSFCRENSIIPDIVLCENGSNDGSQKIIEELSFPGLQKVFIMQRSFGLAYRYGIQKAENDIIYFTGIDFPFGYQNILECLKYIRKYDIVFASKAHQKSILKNSLKRRVISNIFRFLVRILLGLKTRDPQGCVMFRRKNIIKILKNCDSKSVFFATQIALYLEHFNYKTIEIPVRYLDVRLESKINIRRDCLDVFKAILRERSKITEMRKKY